MDLEIFYGSVQIQLLNGAGCKCIEVLIRDQMAAGGGKWTEAAGNIIK